MRGAAAFALGQMAEWLAPECCDHHAAVVPALLALAEADATPGVQQRALYALDVWLGELEQDLEQYVPQLLRLLQARESQI